MTIEHIDEKKFHKLMSQRRIGFFLTECEDGMRGRRGDYTDGHTRYHLVEEGVCLICKSEPN